MHSDSPESLAMVFTAPGEKFEKRNSFIPDLQKGEVLVRISYSTICSSDLHTYCGRRHSPAPSILGHEIIGIVEAVSDSAHYYSGGAIQKGDRITWAVYAYDHKGEMAKMGVPQKSADLFKYGHHQISKEAPLGGGFASHCILKKGTDIFRLNADVPNEVAAPINCTHATIAGALRLAEDLENKKVLVIGSGMLGLSACAMSSIARADKVIALDQNPERLKLALEFGAEAAFVSSATEKPLAEIQCQGGIDLIIDSSGSPDAIETFLPALNIGGRLILVGSVFKQRDLQINAEDIVRKLWTIRGLHNYGPQDLAYALNFIQEWHEKFPFQKLVSQSFALEDIDQAFSTAQNPEHIRVGVRNN